MTDNLKNQYALIDHDGVVFNVVMADSADDVRAIFGSLPTLNTVVSCEEVGFAWIGGTWDGETFSNPDPEQDPVTYERPVEIEAETVTE
jgi:hypothetical protein